MQLVSRSYLAAGVALAGAGAIAVSPLAPPAPDLHLPAIDASSAAVNLTAAANPLQLWADVIGTAFENVGGLGEQVLADPAPILRQVIANQLHSANVLGTATEKLADGLALAFDPDYILSFTGALRQAADEIAAGDYANGFASAAGSFMMLGLPLIDFVGNPWAPGAWSVVAQPFANLANLVTKLPDGVPALLANGILAPLAGTAAASGYVLENLVAAANDGDPAEFVSTLANSPATITGALLNGFELASDDGMPPTVFGGLLNAPDAWGTGGTISTVLSTFSRLADALATPGADRDDLFGTPPALDAAPEAVTANSTLALTAKTVTLDVAPTEEISSTPAASQAVSVAHEPTAAVEDAASDDTPSADADAKADTAADSGSTPKAATTKVSTKASPKATRGQSKANSAKAVRTQVKSAAKKLTDGLKKDKPATQKKADKKTSSGSAKSSDK